MQQWRRKQERVRVKGHLKDMTGRTNPRFLLVSRSIKRLLSRDLLMISREYAGPTSSQHKSLLLLMWMALKEKVLVLLSIAAIISLVLGLFQDFGTPQKSGEAPVNWVEGIAIMSTIIIIVSKLSIYQLTTGGIDCYFQVIVGSLNDWQKERQFKILNDKKKNMA